MVDEQFSGVLRLQIIEGMNGVVKNMNEVNRAGCFGKLEKSWSKVITGNVINEKHDFDAFPDLVQASAQDQHVVFQIFQTRG